MPRLRVNLCQALALGVLMAVIMPAATGQTYNMKILSRNASGGEINSTGEVVGTFRKHGGVSRAFLWTKTTGLQDLGAIDGASFATAINNTGQVVGWFGNPGAEEAFLWTKTTGMQDLGFAGTPAAINDAGQIAGNSNGSNTHAIFWTAASGLQDLGTLGGCCSKATGINNSGQVVGWSFTASADQHPFLWTQAGGMTDLGVEGQASAINNAGQVAGYYYYGSMESTFLWTTASGLQDLGIEGFPFSISDNGWVIGWLVGEANYSFLWSESTGLHNVSQLTSSQVNSLAVITINNAGQIAGGAELLTGNGAAVLLTPIISVSAVSSPNPSHVGQAFTVTATATSIQGPPPDGENIEFYNGKVLLGSAPMVAGVAQFTTSSAKPGKLHIKAVYSGDVNYDPSKPAAVTQVIIK